MSDSGQSVPTERGGLVAWFFAPADPRSYAALRIGYAVAALFIWIDLWPIRHDLFASGGLFGAAPEGAGPPIDVYAWAETDAAVTAVMLGALAAILLLALGVQTRLAAIGTYAWAVSSAVAAPVAQSGFDVILRVVGFVLVISPVVSTWALTGRRRRTAPPVYGLRLVQWQLMLIYVSTVWLKAPDPFWRNGEAISYFLMSMFARAPGPAAAHLGALGALLTYGTLLIEAAVPFLLYVRRTRWIGVVAGICLHGTILATSRLALFTIAVLPLYFAFFETRDFELLARYSRRLRRA